MMSLINEALKRTEQEKRRALDPDSADVNLPPVYNPPPHRSRSFAVVFWLSAGLIVVGCIVWKIVATEQAQDLAPQKAHAGQARPIPAPQNSAMRKREREGETVLTKTADTLHSASASLKSSSSTRPYFSEKHPLRSKKELHGGGEHEVTTQPTTQKAAKFTLNGIMHEVGGRTAIINGKLVREGDSLGDAVVVKIHDQSVELELNSRRFHIHM